MESAALARVIAKVVLPEPPLVWMIVIIFMPQSRSLSFWVVGSSGFCPAGSWSFRLYVLPSLFGQRAFVLLGWCRGVPVSFWPVGSVGGWVFVCMSVCPVGFLAYRVGVATGLCLNELMTLCLSDPLSCCPVGLAAVCLFGLLSLGRGGFLGCWVDVPYLPIFWPVGRLLALRRSAGGAELLRW